MFPKNISTIYFYETYPVCKITGKADVKQILEMDTEELWNIVKNDVCLYYYEFINYFGWRNTGIAIELCNVCKFNNPIELSTLNIKRPPQNFMFWKGKI